MIDDFDLWILACIAQALFDMGLTIVSPIDELIVGIEVHK